MTQHNAIAVYDAFGAPPSTLPPSTPVRRWDEAMTLGALVGVAIYVGLALALWRDLPMFGSRPPMGLGSFMLAGLKWRELFSAPFEMLTRAAVMNAGALMLGGWAFVGGLKPHTRIRHISGPRLLEGREAVCEAEALATRERGKGKAFLTLHPALDLPKSRWTRHMLVYGSVGSGKTQIILPIVAQAFEQNLKAFLYDVKGDFTSKFPTAALVSPWDARSRVWDIGADVRTPSQAATFAAALIPIGDEGGNRYFTVAAQQLLLGVVRSLQKELGSTWGWTDLAQRVNAERSAFAKTLAQHYPKAAALIADDGQAASGVLSTLAAYTRVIDDLALAWGNGEGRKSVSLRRWIRDDFRGRRQIIVQGGPDAALTSAYIGAMVRLLESMIISPAFPDNEQGRTLLFVLDELPSLKVDISALIDKGRSKGVCVIAGLQDLVQLREAIGNNKAAALTSMVGTHVVCRIQMGESRDAVAAMFGRERIAIVASSSNASAGGTSSNTSVHEETRAVVDPPFLSSGLGVRQATRKDWPHGFAIRGIVSTGADALVLDFPGVVMADLQASHVPAEWTLPVRAGSLKPTPQQAEEVEAESAVPVLPTRAAELAALAQRFSRETPPSVEIPHHGT